MRAACHHIGACIHRIAAGAGCWGATHQHPPHWPPVLQVCSLACAAPARHTCRLTKLSGPLIIQNFLAYSTTVVAVAFVGHLNQPELLSSAVLANSLYNVTGYSLLQGLASGMESLCGQVCWHTI